MNARGQALAALSAALQAGPSPAMADDRWMQVLALANEHLMTPTLRWTLAPHGAAVSSDVRAYLDHLYHANARRNRAIRRQALEIVRALNAAGIEPMLLKGVLMTLVERRFDRGARMMADIDVVVPAAALEDALAALRGLGYAINREFPAGHHAVGEYWRPGDPAAVDVHIELIDQAYLLPAAELWAAAGRVRAAGGAVYRVPSPTHRVLHNILHAQVHYRGGYYRGDLELRQLFELAYLARTYGRRVDWAGIAERMRAHRLTPMLQSYLLAAQELFGMSWPLRTGCLRRAKIHVARCRMQLCHPELGRAMTAWANLRAAFAWHRMSALYRVSGGSALLWRWRHVRVLCARHRPSFFLERLFR